MARSADQFSDHQGGCIGQPTGWSPYGAMGYLSQRVEVYQLKPISTKQVRELVEAKVISSFKELEDSDYYIEYEAVAGEPNAVAATSGVPEKADLVAAAELLFSNGRTKDANGKVLKTQRGRLKSVLGNKDGLGIFAISISKPPSGK